MRTFSIRPVQPADADQWLELRRQLWPDSPAEEHRAEIDEYITGRALEPAAVLVAEDAGRLIGFVELSIRAFAEGCVSNRVAYLEGWYVLSSHRRRGVGRALVAACEEWGRREGCSEFASDTSPANAQSISAHAALGFVNLGPVICFRKNI